MTPHEPAKVLVVDDEYDLLQTLSGVLQDEGYEVEAFGSGKAALQRLAEVPFAVALLDVMMPQVGGVQMLRSIRAMPDRQGTPVILMSALPVDPGKNAEPRCDTFLVKPFDVDALLNAVARLSGRTKDG